MRLLKDRIRTSLWLVPTIALMFAIAMAVLLVSIDPQVDGGLVDWLMFERSPESARELLSTIATSMLTFTALVFSITVLVLQLASNQFSPRAIRTFLESRVTKLTMAMFVGTFAYTVVVLSQVRTDPPFVPALATWIALVLVLVSVGIFIEYLHRIAHSVRAISVIVNIANEARHTIDDQFSKHTQVTAEQRLPEELPDQLVVQVETCGVFAAVHIDDLVELARSSNAVVEVVPKIGEFIPTGGILARVWGGRLDGDAVRSAVAIESERTPGQDPGFGIRQLADIALRALSPGINDPTTALQALDHLHDLLRRLATRKFVAPTHADATGTLRLHVTSPDYADLVELALAEIVHYGSSSPLVVPRLRRLLEDCLTVALPEHHRALNARLALLDGIEARHAATAA